MPYDLLGLRVIRGPDWNQNDDDGGEGHVGTVAKVNENGTVNVIWDGGQVTECREGQNHGHDLYVLDNATVGIRHPNVTCSLCQESGIIGIRWRCAECINVDLCSDCYFSDQHDCAHPFYRHETSRSTPEKVECRIKSKKMRVLGTFPEATVVRGPDWQWADQDGGEGLTGCILRVMTPSSESARSVVQVEWQNGLKNMYRRGFEGRVDVKCVEEAPGLECYPQHLPVLESEHYCVSENDEKDNKVQDSIMEGDNVIISVSAEQLQELMQKAPSGWSVKMVECIGKVGKFQGVAPNGDYVVNYGNKKYRLHPDALKKAPDVTIGSRVRILEDEEKVKQLQDGHGGYNEHMRLALGKVGELSKINEHGDFVVKFGECVWVFSPACCSAAQGAEVDSLPRNVAESFADLMGLGGLGGLSGLGGLGSLGDSKDLEKLLKKQMEMLAKLAGGTTAVVEGEEGKFMKALADRKEDKALEMLEKQPDLAKCKTERFTPLHIAANRGLLRIVTALIDGGADMNVKDSEGDTPLMTALIGGNKEIPEFLIKRGCIVQVSNDNGQTPAHKAAVAGFDTILQLLMTHGADLNAQDKSGDTPLHDAIHKKEYKAAEVLLSWPQIDLHRKNKKSFAPLHVACLVNAAIIAEKIVIQDKSTVNASTKDSFTPLHIGACNGHNIVIQMLLEKGGSMVDPVSSSQQTPLHLAAEKAHLESVHLLVAHDANVNAVDEAGNTPLHLVLNGLGALDLDQMLMALIGNGPKKQEEIRTKIACFLIQKGSNPGVKNKDGMVPLDLCQDDTVKEAVKKCLQVKNSDTLTGTKSVTSDQGLCRKCCKNEADILLVPCGHRVLCGQCLEEQKCPQCGWDIKEMFGKDGKKINKERCSVM